MGFIPFPLCSPTTFYFPELIDWCNSHYSLQNQSIISQVNSKILLTINTEEIQRVLGLDSTNFVENNTVPLVEETLIHKLANLTPQEQISFVHSLQKPEHLFQTLNFPLKAEFFQNPIQLILSVFVQITGLYHDQDIPKSLLGFLLFLSEDTKFNYAKYIVDSIHDQFANYSSLKAFRYQSYLVYLILYKYPLNLDALFDIQDPVPYGVISIIQKSSFVKNQSSGFFLFIEKVIS